MARTLKFARLALTLALHTVIMIAMPAYAADVPQSFTLDGQLFSDAAGTSPLLDSSVSFKVQILDEDKVCVIYEESQSVSTIAAKGYFTVQVGTELGSLKRTSGDSANSMATVFQNLSTITGKLASNGNPCTVPPLAAKRRYVRITIAPASMGSVARVLSPELTIDSVPNAIVAERAESLQGLRGADVLKVNTASGSALSQANLESLFTSTTRYNSLSAIVDGTSANYMRTNSSSGAQLPVLPGAPVTPPIGSIWFDSSDSKLKYQTSVGPSAVGSGAGTVTSVGMTTPSELSVTGAPVTTSGTIAVTWATQTTNKVFAAPDGSSGVPIFRVLVANDIPNLPWNKITSLLPTTLLGYGITDAVKNVGGTPSLESGLDAAKGPAATAGRIWISTDTKEIYRDTGTTWDKLASAAGAAGGDLTGTFPNPTVAKLQGQSISATTPLAGQVLKFESSTWTPSNFTVGDLKTSAGAQQFAGSSTCAASQTLTWSSLTDTFLCTNIAGLAATVIATGTVDPARLPTSATAWTVSGADVYRASGNVGIGTNSPQAALEVAGEVRANLIVEKSTSFTPTTIGWYRIINQNDSMPIQGGIIRIVGAYDNRYTDIELQYNIGGWGVGGAVQQTRYSNYNAGVVDAARISASAGHTYLDIHVSSATTPAPITVYGYGPLMRPMIAAPTVGAIAGNESVSELNLGFGFRSTAGAVFGQAGGNVGIGVIAPQTSLDLSGRTDAVRLPAGTTAQRPGTAVNGDLRYNSQTAALEAYVDGAWKQVSTVQANGGITAPPGSGYFVVTSTAYRGNFGSLADGDAACFTELTATNPTWLGHATASANGLLTPSKVRAFLCDETSCNNLTPLATYSFAVAGEATSGGATFTTDASGAGPGDSTIWSAANYFNGARTYWSDRDGSPRWSTAANGNGYTSCHNWTDDGSGGWGGAYGSSSATDSQRWHTGGSICSIARSLICFVNP